MKFLDRFFPEYQLIFPTQQLNPDRTISQMPPIIIRTAGLFRQSVIGKATTQAYFDADHFHPAGTFLIDPQHPIVTRIH